MGSSDESSGAARGPGPSAIGADLVDRAQAALIGVLAGDALGWRCEQGGHSLGVAPIAPYAFTGWRMSGSSEEVLAGETSDDSQLTLAVARARVCGASGDEAATRSSADWWPIWTETELPLWWLGERGGGRATRNAAASWALETAPWDIDDNGQLRGYFHSGGNGVAIRVLPHVLAHLEAATSEALMKDVFLDGITTHGHPRALIGAQVLALAGYLLGQKRVSGEPGALIEAVLGYFPWRPPKSLPVWWQAAEQAILRSQEAEWQEIAVEMQAMLENVLTAVQGGMTADEVVDQLGARGPMGGAGTVSVAAALHLVSRWQGDPLGAVVFAAESRETDADSIASMTGGLLGLALGREWQPAAWDEVQDAGLAKTLATKIVTGESNPAPRAVREMDLVKVRLALKGGATEVKLDGARTAVVTQPPREEKNQEGTYLRWRLDTSDGQRVYVRL